MKLLPLLAVCAVLLLTGCASIEKQLPEGRADKFRYTRTGKASSTTIEAAKYEKDAHRIKAESWSLTHSNLWVPNIQISAENYESPVGR
jgi:hypothetical protein